MLLTSLLAACATQPQEPGAVTVEEQPGGIVLLSTKSPPLDIFGPFGAPLERHALRVSVHTATGQRTFDLYELVIYDGTREFVFDAALYRDAEGSRPAPWKLLRHGQRCPEYRSGPHCIQLDYLDVEVQEAWLRDLASDPEATHTATVEFIARTGEHEFARISAAEARALLKRLDEYLER